MKLKVIKGVFDSIILETDAINLLDWKYDDQNCSVIIEGSIRDFRLLTDELDGLIGIRGIDDEGEINYFGLAMERIIDDIEKEAGDDIWE
ncbi:hypothetical protein OGH69_08100 [Flavobacterium sp. MFBS3-15]|uniref:hypothetical protein n=1 Tax=Flavobacterium sp. MFBS3-15 TaxID=2989816 RepID=UPI002236B20F|nr:hypothetical protein [Flavobacterium sp. MFBS3-15]MCW4468920.1 hypothetical protein [Flavobacterium sp. MFBS3-15]